MLRKMALVLLGLALAPAAASAAPTPFGHACEVKSAHRLCATKGLSDRVASWDGTPIDVDVRLPPKGEGPWPTVVWLHGFGDGKEVVAGPASAYAKAGYAAVSLSARGFKRSCGDLSSRTPDCARAWLHVADQRYEVRDIQHLLGLLVDQGITQPTKIGATGSSYAGIQALQLAFLKDRIRLPDGTFAPWRSPNGTPMRMAAAVPQIAWSDAVAAVFPGGTFTGAAQATPGYRLASFFDLIANGAQFVNLVAPPGADPSVDLQRWLTLDPKELATPSGRAALGELYRYRSGLAIPGTPVPLLMVQGWTDNAIPVAHALAVYDTLRRRDPRAPIWLTLADFGHWRASNKRRTVDAIGVRNLAFFDHWLKGKGTLPAPGEVTVYRENCANKKSDGPAISAPSYAALTRSTVSVRAPGAAGTVRSDGGLAAVGRAVDPVTAQEHCVAIPVRAEPGTATVDLRVARPFTYLGRGEVTARIVGTGGPRGQIAARLWLVKGRKQQLIDRAVTTVALPRKRTIRFRLNGDAIALKRGARLRLQLLGRDEPTYEASADRFSIAVSDVRLTLPVRERGVAGALVVTPRG